MGSGRILLLCQLLLLFYAEENPYDNGTADDQYFYWYYDTDGQTPIVWTKTEF